MQEIACTPKFVLVLGTETLDWDVIARSLDSRNYPDAYHAPFNYNRYEYLIEETLTATQVIEHQRGIVCERETVYKSKSLEILARFRFAKATDLRDKIYGLLGLASDTLDVRVDHSRSVRDVYIDFFRTYVDATRDLDLLCQSP